MMGINPVVYTFEQLKSHETPLAQLKETTLKNIIDEVVVLFELKIDGIVLRMDVCHELLCVNAVFGTDTPKISVESAHLKCLHEIDGFNEIVFEGKYFSLYIKFDMDAST